MTRMTCIPGPVKKALQAFLLGVPEIQGAQGIGAVVHQSHISQEDNGLFSLGLGLSVELQQPLRQGVRSVFGGYMGQTTSILRGIRAGQRGIQVGTGLGVYHK